jgi:hypothetical protein
MIARGRRLRAWAVRCCDTRTIEFLIDPLITDWQAEHDEAVRLGQRWRRRWLPLAYTLALIKVVVSHEASRSLAAVRDPGHADHHALRRIIRLSATMTLAAITNLILPFIAETGTRAPGALVYVIPQAIPLAIPVGLTVGILWSLGWSGVSRGLAAITLTMALALSAVSFATLAWVVPEANQAFRVSHAGPRVARGVRELPLAEMGRMLRAPDAMPPGMRRSVAWTYHQYWALAFAPASLTLFSLSVARRILRRRWQIGLTGAAAVWVYYALMWGARGFGLDLTWSPPAAAWVANATFILAALVLLRSRRPITPAPG